MEVRCVPATIFVTGLADGPGNAALVTQTAQGFNAPSLRAAISFANNNPGADVIDLTVPGTYQISRPNVGGVGEDQNQTGDFDILAAGGDLTINNTSGGAVTVSGGGLDRVFDINPNFQFDVNNPTPKFTVTLQGFTIAGGVASSPLFVDGNGDIGTGNNPTDVSGGAIRDSFNASLTLQNVVVSGNTAQAAGGAISMENPLGFSTPWTLRVLNSTISNNRAGDAGGGINTKGSGRVIISQSVLSDNVCVNQGAGIWLDTVDVGDVHQSAVLSVNQSLITGNVGLAADQFGGGIGNAGNNTLAAGQAALPGEVPAVSITNSTIANNVTAGSGGGYGDENGQGTLVVVDSTFANNSANLGGGIQADGPSTTILDSTVTGNSSQTNGGGIVVPTGVFTLNNTIVAGNVAGAANFLGGTDPDVMAAVTSGTGNFIGIKDANLTLPAGGVNQVGTLAGPLNPLLGPLQNNGGPLAGAPGATLTVTTEAPLPGSPVIDRAVNTQTLPATDGRGLVRIINGTPDVGAVEFQPPATSTALSLSGAIAYGKPLTLTATVTPQVPGDPVTGTAVFSLDGVALGSVPVSNGTATFTVTPTTATFAPGNHTVSVTYGGDANFTPSSASQAVVAPPAIVTTTTVLSTSGPVAYGKPLTLTATVTPQTAGSPVTGSVTFSLDGTTLGTVPVTNGVATLTITPTTATFKPGNHTLTASYSGDANSSPSGGSQALAAPALPVLTTKLVRMKGHLVLQVLSNGQVVQQFMPKSPPIIQMHDVNGDGTADLVINQMKGKKLVVVAAFSGVTAQRIM
jgi:hypothetical protein